MPELENVMYNFMQCSQMMFGPKVKYGITYKANEPGFLIYTRKHFHNFKVPITSKNFEGALGANLGESNEYVLAEKNKLCIYDIKDFYCKYHIDIKMEDENGSNDDHEILYIDVSHNQNKLGLILGRKLIRDKKEIHNLEIYKRNKKGTF